MTADTIEKPDTKPEPEMGSDLDIILPVGGIIEVAGVKATVKRLRTREFLTLMRVLTTGLGPGLADMKLSVDDPEEMQGEMIALFMLAIPNAIEDFGLFMLQIVEPVDDVNNGVLIAEMQNPEPDVLIDILVVMAEQEKDDLSALVGKGKAALTQIQSLYQPKKKKTSSAGAKGRSPARST